MGGASSSRVRRGRGSECVEALDVVRVRFDASRVPSRKGGGTSLRVVCLAGV